MAPVAPMLHVPAWKKLGLELKFVKDEPVTQSNKSDETTASAKSSKKRSISQANGAGATKKQRLGNSSNGNSEELISHGSAAHERESKIKPEKGKEKEKKKGPRKSVSFSSDTKTADASPETEPESGPIDLTPEKRRTEKKKKREQRSKNRPTDTEPYTPSTPSDPLLTYLSVFHNARSEWKFQKNRETALLKHVLSVDRIPTSYNPALRSYLEGLKSENSRSRAAELAKEAIDTDDAELAKLEGQETARDEYQSAISAYQKKLFEDDVGLNSKESGSSADLDDSWSKRLEKRRRAELVYFLMRGKESTKESPAQLKKKRKSRTVVVESDSESDSDSDNTSDSDTSSSSDSSSDSSSSGTESGSESDPDSSSSESESDSD